MDNAAQQTANKIVDTLVSKDNNRTEEALTILTNKLYTDVWSAEPTNQGRTKFIEDVFTDVNNQYLDGKKVPSSMALAWAEEQFGHQLPKDGFNKDDLIKVENSTDPGVTVLDKFMAGQLVKDYGDLQQNAKTNAFIRAELATYCANLKEIDPAHPVNTFAATCSTKLDPADGLRRAGVIREIIPVDVQQQLQGSDYVPKDK